MTPWVRMPSCFRLSSFESSKAFCQRLLGAPVLIAVISDSGVSSSWVKSTTEQRRIAIPTAIKSGKTKSPKNSFRCPSRPARDCSCFGGPPEADSVFIPLNFKTLSQSVKLPASFLNRLPRAGYLEKNQAFGAFHDSAQKRVTFLDGAALRAHGSFVTPL